MSERVCLTRLRVTGGPRETVSSAVLVGTLVRLLGGGLLLATLAAAGPNSGLVAEWA